MKNNKILENEQVEELEVEFQDVVRLLSGIDENGDPNSSAVISIDSLIENLEMQTEQTISLENAVISLLVSGGCLVIQADFELENAFACRRATQIAADWLANMNTEEYINKLLFFVVTPICLPLAGQIYLLLHDLVYFSHYVMENKTQRLILCFDNLSTQIIATEDIDIQKIQMSIERELKNQEQDLEEEAFAIHESMKETKNDNPYAQRVKETYNTLHFSTEENHADEEKKKNENPNFRFQRHD